VSDLFAGGFFLCWGYFLWLSFLLSSELIYAYPHFYYTGYPALLLWGPILYLFLDSLLNDDFEMSRAKWMHLAPGIVSLFTLIPLFTEYDNVSKLELIRSTIEGRFNNFYAVATEIGAYSMIVYLIVILIVHYYPSRPARIRYQMLIPAVAIMVPAIVLHSVSFRNPNSPGYMAASLVSCLFIFALFLTVYSNSSISEEITDKMRQRRYERSTRLQNVDRADVDSRLKEIMEQEQPYLEVDLNLNTLSKKLNLSGPQLSEFINRYYGSNFNTYINRFRVKKAKQLLDSNPDQNITFVALDCGFNSLSSFNIAFRKILNTTPGKYRRRIESSESPPIC